MSTAVATSDAERLALGSALAFPQCAPSLFRRLRPPHFTIKAHRLIYEAMLDHHKRGLEVDPPLISAQLKSHPEFIDGSAAGYLMELVDGVATIANVDLYAEQVLEAARKRQLYGIAEAASDAAQNGQTANDVFRMLTADLDDYRRDIESAKPRFPLIAAAELATATFVLNYLIERVFVEKQPCILGGPKKSLKTTLAILLALSLVTGFDLFGKFSVCTPQRVLMCSAESGMSTIQETVRRICAALGITLEFIDGLYFTTAVPKPHDPSSMADFRAVLEETQAQVVILDPAYKMFSGDGQESIFKMGDILGRVSDLCDELSVTLILCHHLKTSRLNPYAPAELDDLAFAGFAEHFRQWLLIARREAYAPGSGYHALWLTIGGSAGHNSLWAIDIDEGHADAPGGRTWHASIQRSDEARDAAEQRKEEAKGVKAGQQFEADCTAICRLLAKHPNGATKTFIRDHVDVSGRRFPSVLTAMYEAGQIIDCEVQVGNKRTPQSGFKLNSEAT